MNVLIASMEKLNQELQPSHLLAVWSNASIGCPTIWQPSSQSSFLPGKPGYRFPTGFRKLAESPTNGLYCSYHLRASSGADSDLAYYLAI